MPFDDAARAWRADGFAILREREGVVVGGAGVRRPRCGSSATSSTARHTADLPALPNWYPRSDVDAVDSRFVAASGRPDLCAAEVSAAGPAGTVVAFTPGTVHRGTAPTRPGGARYSMHLSYRPVVAEWAQRHGWADRSHDPAWYRFVERATPRRLAPLGFPAPGHPFWTTATPSAVALRYPGLDLAPWRRGSSGQAGTVGDAQ